MNMGRRGALYTRRGSEKRNRRRRNRYGTVTDPTGSDRDET